MISDLNSLGAREANLSVSVVGQIPKHPYIIILVKAIIRKGFLTTTLYQALMKAGCNMTSFILFTEQCSSVNSQKMNCCALFGLAVDAEASVLLHWVRQSVI